MPQGQAAMIVNETGIVPFWIRESPDFNFGIAPLPVLKEPVAIAAAPPGGFWWVSANSERGIIAGDIFAFLGSAAGQQTWQRVGGGSLPVIFPQANEVESIDPRLQNAYAYFEQIMRIRPEPAARNPDVSLVLQEQRAITPNFGTVIQGLFTGQVSDPRTAMQDLQDRSEAELDRAITAAQANGAQISRDDYTFPNWEPTQDYTQADYDALQS
jgi:multiple sugar transport system substrate-binding protein